MKNIVAQILFVPFIVFVLILPLNLYAQNVLVIGDSHTAGIFGKSLEENLVKLKYKTFTYGSCGSVGAWWFSGQATNCGFYFNDGIAAKSGLKSATPLVDGLLKKHLPQFVIVALGANYTASSDTNFIVNDLTRMKNKVKESGAKCFWVTMPDSRKLKDKIQLILKLTKQAVSDYCTIYESHLYSTYPATGGDGIHYDFGQGFKAAKDWSTHLSTKFNEWSLR